MKENKQQSQKKSSADGKGIIGKMNNKKKTKGTSSKS